MSVRSGGLSSLLNENEHETVFWLAGDNSEVLATTIVQMYTAKNVACKKWTKSFAGVLCFVKDSKRKKFYLQLLCLEKKKKLWEQFIHQDLNYEELIPPCHVLEADTLKIAFNFRSEEEAEIIKECVFGVIQHCIFEKEAENVSEIPTKCTENQTVTPNEPKLTNHLKKMRIRKHSLKLEIGVPKDPQHKIHVSVDEKSKNLSVQGDEIHLRKFLDQAGITASDLKDEKLRATVRNFFQKFGGIKSILGQHENIPVAEEPSTNGNSQAPDISLYDSVKPPVSILKHSNRNQIVFPEGLYDFPPSNIVPVNNQDLYDKVKAPIPIISHENSNIYKESQKKPTISPKPSNIKKSNSPKMRSNTLANPLLMNEIKQNLEKRSLLSPSGKKQHQEPEFTSRPLPDVPEKLERLNGSTDDSGKKLDAKLLAGPPLPIKKKNCENEDKQNLSKLDNIMDFIEDFLQNENAEKAAKNAELSNSQKNLAGILKQKIEKRKTQIFDSDDSDFEDIWADN